MKKSKLIQRHIISLLEASDKPVSTREMALKTKSAWHSVQLNCMKLQLDGKLDCMKIGNINAWMMRK
jgi:hypothetical protein